MSATSYFSDVPLISLWNEPARVNYAGSKAKADVRDILKQSGAIIYGLSEQDRGSLATELRQIAQKIRNLPDSAIVVLQYPMRPTLAIPKSCQVNAHDVFNWIEPVLDAAEGTILIVHDLKSLQVLIYDVAPSAEYVSEMRELERSLFRRSDVLIVHSPAMASVVTESYGIPGSKMVCLSMFDYLSSTSLSACHYIPSSSCQDTSIAIAGHLGRRNLINVILRDLPQCEGLRYDLYGSLDNASFKKIDRPDVAYHGSIAADELPLILCRNAHYGLIWGQLDQDELLYLQMVAPHKLSLYIRAGLAVIAPSGTYAGELVNELGIGYAIESLGEILELLEGKCRSLLRLRQMMPSIENLQQKVNCGGHTRQALEVALAKFQ